jgi:cytochrome P450
MSEASEFASLLFRIAQERNGENVVLTLGGIPVFVVQDAESAHQVLRRSAANFEKNMVWFRQALGASRFTENGDEWQFRQKLSQRFLSRFDPQRTWEASKRLGMQALRAIADESAAGAASISDAILRHLAAGIMLDVFFDRDLEQDGIDLEDIALMLRFGSEYSFVPEGALIPFPADVTRAFLKVRAKVLADMQVFREWPASPGGLLGALRAADEARDNSFHLEHEMTMFFAAASETTAATMGWAMFLLSRHPELQTRLRQALDGLPEEPSWEDVEGADLLRSFVVEVLRMFPSTPVIARRAVAAEQVGDYLVRAGEQILISLVGIQHDRRLRENPWEIRLDPEGHNGKSHSFSFSLGPRMCGGSRFAMFELMALLTVFLRHARFEPTSDAPPRFRFQTQLMHEGGQPVSVSLLR